MKKFLPVTIFLLALVLMPSQLFAQGMMGNWGNPSPSGTSNDQTVQEEAEGKTIWDKLQTKQLDCKNLTDDNFDVLGEYFMGQSIGNTQQHATMNQMMKNMMGDTGETQMHIALGKRYSGCDTHASYPQNGWSFMPMMWMMGYDGWGNMMDWGGLGLLGWIPMIAFWILLILVVVALVRYLGGSGKISGQDKMPLDILKERYAKGEIDKKEFEEMKKDLR